MKAEELLRAGQDFILAKLQHALALGATNVFNET